jgi:hypothetical protein
MNKQVNIFLNGTKIGHIWNTSDSRHIPIPRKGDTVSFCKDFLNGDETYTEAVYEVDYVIWNYRLLVVVIEIHLMD